jgi:general secretion pathway protein J
MTAARARHISQAGFTLIETLAALVLLGLIVSVLATITSQWMPRWNIGFHRIQRSEALGMALDRISADIAASEYVPFDPQTKSVLFDGTETAITLARASLGPNAGRGLDVVRIAATDDRKGAALTRSRAAYTPGAESTPKFSDTVVLLRAPYRLSFSYAGSDRIWKPSWRNSDTLPTAVLLTVHDAGSGRLLPIARVAAIHVSAPAQAVCKQLEGCDAAPLQSASRDAPIGAPGQ